MNFVLWNKPPIGRCKTGYTAPSNLSQSEHWACVLSCYSVAKLCLFVTPWTVALQALLFMGFSCHEYWSGLPCPPPGDLPNPGIEPGSPHCRWILYHLSHQENLSGEWSSWIEFSEWIYSTFCSKCHLLIESPTLFCLDLSNFPFLPAPCPQRVSLHSLQPILHKAENVTKTNKQTNKNQILLKILVVSRHHQTQDSRTFHEWPLCSSSL